MFETVLASKGKRVRVAGRRVPDRKLGLYRARQRHNLDWPFGTLEGLRLATP